VFSTAAAFVIYFRLIQTLGSVGTTAQAYLRVPIGVALGVLFLGENLTSTAWIGLACVVAGVAAMTIPARKVAAARTGAAAD
jgi:drug/metabolite transporter (DMT)-like permease